MASLTELRAFHLVAEAGSFSQAARDGAVTQSTLSAQVRGLEKSAGAMLFEQRARGVRLKLEGESLHSLTSRMFDVEREVRHLLTGGSRWPGACCASPPMGRSCPRAFCRICDRPSPTCASRWM